MDFFIHSSYKICFAKHCEMVFLVVPICKNIFCHDFSSKIALLGLPQSQIKFAIRIIRKIHRIECDTNLGTRHLHINTTLHFTTSSTLYLNHTCSIWFRMQILLFIYFSLSQIFIEVFFTYIYVNNKSRVDWWNCCLLYKTKVEWCNYCWSVLS